jgi:hypothetical protein
MRNRSCESIHPELSCENSIRLGSRQDLFDDGRPKVSTYTRHFWHNTEQFGHKSRSQWDSNPHSHCSNAARQVWPIELCGISSPHVLFLVRCALLHLIPTSVIPSRFIRIVKRSMSAAVCLYFTPQQLAHRDLYIAIPNGWKTHGG